MFGDSLKIILVVAVCHPLLVSVAMYITMEAIGLVIVIRAWIVRVPDVKELSLFSFLNNGRVLAFAGHFGDLALEPLIGNVCLRKRDNIFVGLNGDAATLGVRGGKGVAKGPSLIQFAMDLFALCRRDGWKGCL